MRSIEPGISRFRVWSFGPSRNDDCIPTAAPSGPSGHPHPPLAATSASA
ncbi:hypothetical protein GTH44_21420 [Bradyrhizobium japonicum]|nr:hypothetical protein [Bradyrhizobium japonicum]